MMIYAKIFNVYAKKLITVYDKNRYHITDFFSTQFCGKI